MKRSISLIIIFLAITCGIVLAEVPPVPDRPYAYVMDLAGIIPPDTERALNNYLRTLEELTTSQVVVLTIQSLEGEPIEEFSIRLVEKWKLGQKDRDNGVLITIAIKDRKYRFEIGYGLEPVLPDSYVGTLGRRFFVPYFRQGRFSEGIVLATRAIAEKIARAEGVQMVPFKGPEGPSVQGHPLRAHNIKKGLGVLDVVLAVVFFLFALCLFIRHPGLFLLLFIGGRGGGGGFVQ